MSGCGAHQHDTPGTGSRGARRLALPIFVPLSVMADPEGNEFCVAALCPRATEPTEPEWSATLRGQRRSDFARGGVSSCAGTHRWRRWNRRAW